MDDDYSITANFQKIEYSLTTASTEGGSVTAPGQPGPFTYDCCTDVDIVATEDEGYDFSHWAGDTVSILDAEDPTTSIHMYDDYSITAVFVEEGVEYCNLSTDSSDGGSVTTPGEGDPVETYVCGTEDVPIVATPDECYEFVNWTGETGTIDDVNAASTTIDMDDDYSIYANFAMIEYDLTTASTAGGSVTTPGQPGPFTYDCGEEVGLLAEATGCYNFVEWTADSPEALADIDDPESANTFITMNGDYSITANFELAEELVDLEIPFNEGWNTFSTPISLHDCVDTWAEFIAVNDLGDIFSIEMIYGYDPDDGWVTVDGGDEIEPLYGFYVKASAAGVAHIIPNDNKTEPPSRDLSRGVSLIGPAPASLGEIDVWTALITIYWASDEGDDVGYTLVVSPPINSPDDWAYARPEPFPEDSPLMYSGRAYWVVMENADEYVGETSTPLP